MIFGESPVSLGAKIKHQPLGLEVAATTINTDQTRPLWRQLAHAVGAALLGLGLAFTLPQAQAQTSSKKRPAATAKAAKTTKAAKKPVARKTAAKTTAKKTRAAQPARVASRPVVPARLSFGQMAGLHHVSDPLDLKSSVAYVMDQDTKEVLLRKNELAVLPIASITKLMTGLLITEAGLPMDEYITITQADVDTLKGSASRLPVGTTLTRQELLHLALMSSENRAAHALGRTYPGGLGVFVQQMNAKAGLLGMADTRFVEPTGLSSSNQSSAKDLATLVNVAHANPALRYFSTSQGAQVELASRSLQYNNTNRLVRNENWHIGLQKTGYISEAGRCLVMQAEVAGRKLIMVFLDSVGTASRLGDAERVRKWVEGADAHHSISISSTGGTHETPTS